VIRHKQIIMHDPENGQYGDCHRTALASLLDLQRPEDVPHFMDGADPGHAYDQTRQWLAGRGLRVVTFPVSGQTPLDDVLQWMEATNPGIEYLLAGTSPRDTDHETVVSGGVLYDPHPSDSALIGPTSTGDWWITLIFPEAANSIQKALPAGASDVLVERRRQVEAEGWTPEHDDQHADCSLAIAAGCYALHADAYPNDGEPPPSWPWDSRWWKPREYRRDLVRAAALLVAEIERLDRTGDAS
jgi:hypothetical protein